MALSLLRQCLSQKPPGRWRPGAHAGLDPAISKIITGGDEVDGGVTGVHSWSTEQPGRNGCWDLLQKVFAFSRMSVYFGTTVRPSSVRDVYAEAGVITSRCVRLVYFLIEKF